MLTISYWTRVLINFICVSCYGVVWARTHVTVDVDLPQYLLQFLHLMINVSTWKKKIMTAIRIVSSTCAYIFFSTKISRVWMLRFHHFISRQPTFRFLKDVRLVACLDILCGLPLFHNVISVNGCKLDFITSYMFESCITFNWPKKSDYWGLRQSKITFLRPSWFWSVRQRGKWHHFVIWLYLIVFPRYCHISFDQII